MYFRIPEGKYYLLLRLVQKPGGYPALVNSKQLTALDLWRITGDFAIVHQRVDDGLVSSQPLNTQSSPETSNNSFRPEIKTSPIPCAANKRPGQKTNHEHPIPPRIPPPRHNPLRKPNPRHNPTVCPKPLPLTMAPKRPSRTVVPVADVLDWNGNRVWSLAEG